MLFLYKLSPFLPNTHLLCWVIPGSSRSLACSSYTTTSFWICNTQFLWGNCTHNDSPSHLCNSSLLHVPVPLCLHFSLTNACPVLCAFTIAIQPSPIHLCLLSCNFEGLCAFSTTKHITVAGTSSQPLLPGVSEAQLHTVGDCPSIQSTWGLRCKQFYCNCLFSAVIPWSGGGGHLVGSLFPST